MKKEIIAITVLVVLFAAVFLNTFYIDSLMYALADTAENAAESVQQGNFDYAETLLRQAINKWNISDGYTHIFIRHSEIDSTSDAFYEMLGFILSEDSGGTAASHEKLRAHLLSIAGMEHITIGSIF